MASPPLSGERRMMFAGANSFVGAVLCKWVAGSITGLDWGSQKKALLSQQIHYPNVRTASFSCLKSLGLYLGSLSSFSSNGILQLRFPSAFLLSHHTNAGELCRWPRKLVPHITLPMREGNRPHQSSLTNRGAKV